MQFKQTGWTRYSGKKYCCFYYINFELVSVKETEIYPQKINAIDG